MRNEWNRLIYKAWAPIYDSFFNKGAFLQARKKVFSTYPFQTGQKILLVGVGTGADIPFIIGEDVQVIAIDYSTEMLQQAKKKYDDEKITFLQMDAQQLDFQDEEFDVIVASLILSVVPNPKKTLQEMCRVLKKNGEVIVFDKFADKEKLSYPKKVVRSIVAILGTDIGVHFKTILSSSAVSLKTIAEKPVMFNGLYKKIILRKE